MKPSCLVIGASGQVGSAVAAELADTFVVCAAPRTLVDLTESSTIAAALARYEPELVVVAGAWTWVDGAEDSPDACMATNVDGPAHIARWCGESEATIVVYSTDHVFDGGHNPYRVGDATNPLNTYARSKLIGEEQVRDLCADHLILRTAWVYGPDEREKNFAIRLVRALERGERVAIPVDQWGTPTYAPDLARTTRRLYEIGARGTFHVVGPDFVDRMTLSQKVCEAFGLDASLLDPIETAALGQRATRPLEVRLHTGVLDELVPGAIRGVDEGLAAMAEWYRG